MRRRAAPPPRPLQLLRPPRQQSDRAKTMKLANKSAKLLVGLALSFCLVSATGAQTAPATTKKAHKKSSAPAAKPAPDAGAAKPVIAESGKRDPFQPLVNHRKA